MVEHTAVNRGVVGSSPTRGVKGEIPVDGRENRAKIWLRGQAVKTSPFHGGNRGSIPLGITLKLRFCRNSTEHSFVVFGPLAQLVRATGS